MPQVTMRDLLEAGVHFGHQSNRWNPKMAPYIFGKKNGVHIVDLSKTVRLLAEAVDFIREVSAGGGQILFVATKRQAKETVRDQAIRAGQFYIVNRWLGGTLTNFKTITKSVDKLKDLERMSQDGSYQKYTKKEVLGFERERERLEANVGGIKEMKGLPRALFVFDPKREDIAISEANKLGIPVVAVCDTNCSPDGVDYVIPGNDDSIRSIRLFAASMAEACIEGSRLKSDRLEDSARQAARAAKDFSVAESRGKDSDDGPEVQHVKRSETTES